VADLNSFSILPRDFYDRDPRRVARDLLGKVLLRTDTTGLLAGRIVETEAYLGTGDPAAHAAAGRTARNQVLFGPPGHAYVYFIYGTHYCLNVSCMAEGRAGCVLIRALQPLLGIEKMQAARRLPICSRPDKLHLRLLTTGPGRLAEALSITRDRDNGKDMTSAAGKQRSDLCIADDGFRPCHIARTPRIGIRKAASSMLRYVIAGNACVSSPRVD
jgi:DNA-3-methyladenine glycosylase